MACQHCHNRDCRGQANVGGGATRGTADLGVSLERCIWFAAYWATPHRATATWAQRLNVTRRRGRRGRCPAHSRLYTRGR
eukprot:6999800-Prymnesium_polylepis.1